MGEACCVSCRAEFRPGEEPDPCLGLIPGLVVACCGHGVKGHVWEDPDDPEGWPEDWVDTCYVGSWALDEAAWLAGFQRWLLYGDPARYWLRSLGLIVPDAAVPASSIRQP